MTAILIRFVLMAVLGAMIYFGIRGIWRDWTAQFRRDDELKRARDRRESKRPDVVELKRDKDGVFRPGGSKDENGK